MQEAEGCNAARGVMQAAQQAPASSQVKHGECGGVRSKVVAKATTHIQRHQAIAPQGVLHCSCINRPPARCKVSPLHTCDTTKSQEDCMLRAAMHGVMSRPYAIQVLPLLSLLHATTSSDTHYASQLARGQHSGC